MKITLDRAVVEQALAAFEHLVRRHYWRGTEYDDRAKALRAALEQPQAGEIVVTTNQQGQCVAVTRQDDEGQILSVIWEAKPQVEQEPVAWLVYTLDGKSVCVTDNPTDFTDEHRALPLYTYPQNLNCKSTQHRLATLWGYEKPQPHRQPLTPKEIVALCNAAAAGEDDLSFAFGFRLGVVATERHHGIRGLRND